MVQQYAALMSAILCSCPRTDCCTSCFERALMWFGGLAGTRGTRWAESVADRRPVLLRQPWPRHDGRAAELARGKVDDLSQDPRVVDHLGAMVTADAARRWLAIQLDRVSARGERWADEVARDRPELLSQPWPVHEGHAAELARAKVASLCDDAQLLDQLALHVAARAARRWHELRSYAAMQPEPARSRAPVNAVDAGKAVGAGDAGNAAGQPSGIHRRLGGLIAVHRRRRTGTSQASQRAVPRKIPGGGTRH